METVLDTLERMVEKGKIRTYGWSTDLVREQSFFQKTETAAPFSIN